MALHKIDSSNIPAIGPIFATAGVDDDFQAVHFQEDENGIEMLMNELPFQEQTVKNESVSEGVFTARFDEDCQEPDSKGSFPAHSQNDHSVQQHIQIRQDGPNSQEEVEYQIQPVRKKRRRDNEPAPTVQGDLFGCSRNRNDLQFISGIENDTDFKDWIDELELEKSTVLTELVNGGVSTTMHGEDSQAPDSEVSFPAFSQDAQTVQQHINIRKYEPDNHEEVEIETHPVQKKRRLDNEPPPIVEGDVLVCSGNENEFQSIPGLEDDNDIKNWINELESEKSNVKKEIVDEGVSTTIYDPDSQAPDSEVSYPAISRDGQTVHRHIEIRKDEPDIQEEQEPEILASRKKRQLENVLPHTIEDNLLGWPTNVNGFQSILGLENDDDIKNWINEMELEKSKFEKELVNEDVNTTKVFEDSQAPDTGATCDQASQVAQIGPQYTQVMENTTNSEEEPETEIQPAPKNCPLDSQPALNDEQVVMQQPNNENNITSSFAYDSEVPPFPAPLEELDDADPPCPLPTDSSTQDKNSGSPTIHEATSAQITVASVENQIEQPSKVESIDNNLKSALDTFYAASYKRFEMARPTVQFDTSNSDHVCDLGLLPATKKMKRNLMLKRDLLNIIESEMIHGRPVNDTLFMEDFAICFLDHLKFDHVCPACETFFTTTRAYSKHFVRHGRSIYCPYRCGTSFTRMESLKRHLKSNHPCGLDMQNEEPGGFRCRKDGCEKLLKSRQALAFHTWKLHGREDRLCRICRARVDNAEEMRTHLLTEHDLTEGEPLSYVCDVEGCNQRCRTGNGLIQHKNLKHGTKNCTQPNQTNS